MQDLISFNPLIQGKEFQLKSCSGVPLKVNLERCFNPLIQGKEFQQWRPTHLFKH